MPIIEVKVFERRLEDETQAERIAVALTDALCSVIGEQAREQTWVIVEGVPAARWAIGGKVGG
jgi:4-oxalocrotonate tautomerase